VADGPGANTETSRTLLLCADLGSGAVKASMLEFGRSSRPLWRCNTHIESGAAGRGPSSVLSMVGKNYR